jgi:gamma-glutamylcysteine synthetase
MTRTYNDLVTEITEWLDGILKPGLDLARFAEAYINESEPRGDGTIHFEVSGRHSHSGNPVPASFDYYDEAA